MSDLDERIRFETQELDGLARHGGARRVVDTNGVGAWQFPVWICPHCGPDAEALADCPEPLARHGKIPEGAYRG